MRYGKIEAFFSAIWQIIQDVLAELQYEAGNNPGILSVPVLTDNEDGTVDISAIDVLIRSTSDHIGGRLYKKTVPLKEDLVLTQNQVNFIYIDWNSGSPIFKVTTNRNDINNSDIIPVFRIYALDNLVKYHANYGTIGNDASIRNFDRVMRVRGTTGIEKESGLVITESATRIINISAGYLWFGLNRIELDTIVSDDEEVICELWYHLDGVWTFADITTYNNTQYDDGDDLVELTPNRYAVNWIFRNIETNEIDIVLGNGDYTLAQAEASEIPSLPPFLSYFYILLGRIIVKNGVNTATAIENQNGYEFNPTIVSEHNELGGLQGGAAEKYYHLTGVLRDTFVNGDLVEGILTITHNFGLDTNYSVKVIILNNEDKEIIPDEITCATNTVTVDLSSYEELAGIWKYLVLG